MLNYEIVVLFLTMRVFVKRAMFSNLNDGIEGSKEQRRVNLTKIKVRLSVRKDYLFFIGKH